jgi:hypothetical protein
MIRLAPSARPFPHMRHSSTRMSLLLRAALPALVLIGVSACAPASTGSSDVAPRVVDVPTRPGVIQRFVLLSPPEPKATVVLFAGDHGGLQIAAGPRFTWGAGGLADNFLMRSRQLFVEHDLAVAIVDAPSDRQFRFLTGFRQTPAHAADIKAVIAWLREHVEAPVWLIGTSMGTLSVGYLATQLTGRDGPDGIVLTSTILTAESGTRPVPAMELETLRIPVLVVHHEQDGCRFCLFRDMPALMHKLDAVPRKELIAVTGGVSRGDPCQAFAYHGYNGIEHAVVARIAEWIVSQ